MRIGFPRNALFGLAFAAIALAAIDVAWGAPSPATPRTADELLASVKAAKLDDHPLVSLHDLFPDEWKRFSTGVAAKLPDRAAADAYTDAYVAALIERRWERVAAAPASVLKTLARSDFILLADLQEQDVKSCADFGDERILPSSGSAKVTDARRMYVTATLMAIAAGASSPTVHGGPTPADVGPVAIAFAENGGTTSQWDALVQADTSGLSPEERCQAWLAYYAAVADAPDRTAGRFLAIRYSGHGPQEAGVPERDAPRR